MSSRVTAIVVCFLMLPFLAAQAGPRAVWIDTGDIHHESDETRIEFQEDPDSTWYYLWLSQGKRAVVKKWFSSEDASCDGHSCSIVIDRLEDGDYRGWVRTWAPGERGPWSKVFKFKVDYVRDAMKEGMDDDILASPRALWVNHLDLMSTGPELAAHATTGGELLLTANGLAGFTPMRLVTGLQVPPGYEVAGAELCHRALGVAQVDALTLLAIGEDPVEGEAETGESWCAQGDSGVAVAFDPPVMASTPLALATDVSFQGVPDPSLDGVLVTGVALKLVRDLDDPLIDVLIDHSHAYLTGKGNGHNNTLAHTGEPRAKEHEHEAEHEHEHEHESEHESEHEHD